MATGNPKSPLLRNEDRRVFQQHRDHIYEGIVEYVDDPRNNFRAKVRWIGVNSLDPAESPTLKLPWALGAFPPGGQSAAPEVGDTVLGFFRKGDVNHPVYFAKVYGVLLDEDYKERMRGRMPGMQNPGEINRETAQVGSFSAPAANNDLTYEQPSGNDAPLETFLKRTSAHPYVQSALSSPKGAVIYVSDEPEHEALNIIDRGGAIFEMVSPVLKSENIGNMARRGIGESISGTAISLDKMVDGKARVRLYDQKGQFLAFLPSNDGFSTVRLSGMRPDRGSKSGYIEIRETKCEIELRSDLKGFIKIDDGIHAEDSTGAYIDIHNGTVTISGTAVNITASGPVNINGNPINLN